MLLNEREYLIRIAESFCFMDKLVLLVTLMFEFYQFNCPSLKFITEGKLSIYMSLRY